jgi:hypothetical protein
VFEVLLDSGFFGMEAKFFLSKSRVVPIALTEVHSALNNIRVRLAAEAMRNRFLRPAINCNTTMKKAIKTPVVLGLLLTLAGGVVASRAEDTKPSTPAVTTPATPKKPVQQQLNGKVVSVDKYGKTITLQVDNLTYVLQVTDSTRVSKAGKDQTLTDVVVGQEPSVNVLLRELPDGRIEVAVLSVDLTDTAEAQGNKGRGRGHGHGRGRGHGHGHGHGPFHHGPHPPNHDGPVVSPHR